MKLQFKHTDSKADAGEAVVDRFADQPKLGGVNYRLDPGKLAASRSQSEIDYGTEAFRHAPLMLDEAQLLENIQKIQRRRNLPQSKSLVATKSARVNLDIEMELDDFQSWKLIDVLAVKQPILILHEPQKMEGKQTVESLPKFKPLFVLRYCATHKTEHNTGQSLLGVCY